MAKKLDILIFPDPRLRKVAEKVTKFKPKKIFGIDISEVSINKAKKKAKVKEAVKEDHILKNLLSFGSILSMN